MPIVSRSYSRPLLALALCFVAACDLPRDPEQTYQRVHGGMLRVGVSACPPWTNTEGDEPSGLEPELVRELAEQLGAEVQWTVDGQDRLLERLGRHELDLVVCGLTESSPWFPYVGATQAYVTANDQQHIMAAPAGENRWLLELDRFLQARRAMISQRVSSAVAP